MHQFLTVERSISDMQASVSTEFKEIEVNENNDVS